MSENIRLVLPLDIATMVSVPSLRSFNHVSFN